ncbi:MAG: orotate phosphoribosyltransferase [Paludibacteraceae bacterium]|jgi:orotate phosphoribosyltransferase|nr:orotate phosphoribosyltransferase [Paludibacteraceae bacterium]
MKVLQEMTAVRLLQLKAIKFQPKNPFIWANGWNAPMYCDDRKVLSYPKMRDFIRLELARVIAEMYPDADIIAGVATNAIAHGVLVAQQLSMPFVYVHPQPKDHGLENQIEGDLRPRQSVVIVENQVNTGENILKVVEAIRNNGCKVLGVVTIFDYCFAATKRKLDKIDVSLTSLTNIETVLRHAFAMDLIDEEQKQIIEQWQHNPAKWEK